MCCLLVASWRATAACEWPSRRSCDGRQRQALLVWAPRKGASSAAGGADASRLPPLTPLQFGCRAWRDAARSKSKPSQTHLNTYAPHSSSSGTQHPGPEHTPPRLSCRHSARLPVRTDTTTWRSTLSSRSPSCALSSTRPLLPYATSQSLCAHLHLWPPLPLHHRSCSAYRSTIEYSDARAPLRRRLRLTPASTGTGNPGLQRDSHGGRPVELSGRRVLPDQCRSAQHPTGPGQAHRRDLQPAAALRRPPDVHAGPGRLRGHG